MDITRIKKMHLNNKEDVIRVLYSIVHVDKLSSKDAYYFNEEIEGDYYDKLVLNDKPSKEVFQKKLGEIKTKLLKEKEKINLYKQERDELKEEFSVLKFPEKCLIDLYQKSDYQYWFNNLFEKEDNKVIKKILDRFKEYDKELLEKQKIYDRKYKENRKEEYEKIDSMLLEGLSEKEEGRSEKLEEYMKLRKEIKDKYPKYFYLNDGSKQDGT